MIFRQLFDRETCTYTYLLADEESREAVLIDPVREHLERDSLLLDELGLTLKYVLDTHVHADHITSSGQHREARGCRTVLSAHGGASCPDMLVDDGDVLQFGRHAVEVRTTPGHTNGCVTYVCHEAGVAFTGDTLLIRGCGRTDFQQGSAETLYRSVHEKIFSLPEATRLYPGHDYKGRTVTTVREEKAHNPRLGGGRTLEQFIEIMENLNLSYPKKIDVAVPANLVCGLTERLPRPAPADLGAAVQRTGAGVPEVDAAWVAANAAGARLVDVRETYEFNDALGHIAGAELVPLASLIDAASGWDRQAPVIVYCRSGGRSGRAALAMEQMGFKRVASMAGGMIDWNKRSLPVEGAAATGAPPASCG